MKTIPVGLFILVLTGCGNRSEGIPIAFTYSGYDGIGMWVSVAGLPEPRMKYLLYRPSNRPVNWTRTPYYDVPPTGRPLAIHPEGLYWNGVPVPLDQGRVFVLTREMKIVPVPLGPEDLAVLETRSVHGKEFYEGEVWKRRILPALRMAGLE